MQTAKIMYVKVKSERSYFLETHLHCLKIWGEGVESESDTTTRRAQKKLKQNPELQTMSGKKQKRRRRRKKVK